MRDTNSQPSRLVLEEMDEQLKVILEILEPLRSLPEDIRTIRDHVTAIKEDMREILLLFKDSPSIKNNKELLAKFEAA